MNLAAHGKLDFQGDRIREGFAADTTAGLYSPGQLAGAELPARTSSSIRANACSRFSSSNIPRGNQDGIQQKFSNTVYQALVGP